MPCVLLSSDFVDCPLVVCSDSACYEGDGSISLDGCSDLVNLLVEHRHLSFGSSSVMQELTGPDSGCAAVGFSGVRGDLSCFSKLAASAFVKSYASFDFYRFCHAIMVLLLLVFISISLYFLLNSTLHPSTIVRPCFN